MADTPANTAHTDLELDNNLRRALHNRYNAGHRHGPCYSEDESAPLIWHDQLFQREITPQGAVACAMPLRVGSTQNGLDLILVASHKNTEAIQATAGATVTLTLLQADGPCETFTETGPTICVKAPANGIRADPDHLFARFAIGNFTKPWLKAKLEFAGSITGGSLDCALSYAAR